MLHIKPINSIEVVCDKKHHVDPLKVTRRVHAKYDHEANQLHQQCWLQDDIIAKQSDSVVVLIQIRQSCFDLLRCRVDADSLLETMVHQRQSGHEEVLLRREIRLDLSSLVMPSWLIRGE